MKSIIFLIAIFLACDSIACSNPYWKQNYFIVDSASIAVNDFESIEDLVQKLTAPYPEPVNKYRAIYTWIAHHISYDCEALKNPDKRKVTPVDVLQSRKSVCQGYSNLFKEMSRLAGLENEVIKGWGKTLLQEIGHDPVKSNHAWNAIKINEQWFLCDVTWGAGVSVDDCKEFKFFFKEYYFCTPPELFSLNHFPDNTQWLLKSDVAKKGFTTAPLFYSEAINLNIKNFNQKTGTIKYVKDKVLHFKFESEMPVESIRIKTSADVKSKGIVFTNKNGTIEFDYTLTTYARSVIIYINTKGTVAYIMER